MDSETIERLKELAAKAYVAPGMYGKECRLAAHDVLPDLLAAAEENVRLREALERIGRHDYDDIDGSFTEAAARIARAALNGGSK